MNSRGTVIAALLAVELVIVGEAGIAVRGAGRADARTASGAPLIEDGPHRMFDAGPHPALIVDIGYADLTIVKNVASHIDVSVTSSTAYGALRSTAPITAREDGETIHIAATGGHRWSIGDDRMVTVYVPPATQVTVVNAGDIRASGLRAPASFKSIGRGSVTVEDYDASALRVASSMGRISLRRIVAARLDATSSDGSVDGTALQVRDGSIEGDDRVTLAFAAGADTLVTAQTDDGAIRLSGFSARPSVATGRDERGEDDASMQTVRVGAGEGHLDVHASDGNITLAQDGEAVK